MPYVRPDVRAYLDNLQAHPRPTLTREMLAMIRKIPAEKMKSTDDLPMGELATVKDVIMPGPGGEIRLRLFDARAERDAGPVLVFFHGGAYIVGSIETHESLTAEMARQLDLPVISVEYRLAPENPWPAAVDDGEAAARWIAENGKAFGREFTGLILSGDSAGGNLTLVTALALRDQPATLPVIMQLPIYPASDRTKKYPSAQQFSQGYGLDISDDDEDFYAADPNSLRASPLLADLHGLPPTVLVTASLDPLRDQGRAYAAKLIEAGVPTSYYEAKGNIHGFATYRQAIPSAQQDTLNFLELARILLKQQADSSAH
ncbi:alpha/beta hydrolase [Pseudomaricurvus hydrocarbonicus]